MKINFSSPITLWLCFLSFVGFFLVQVGVLTNFFILKGNFLENSNTWFLSCAGYIFGHASFSHFFGNVSILLLLGPIVEERFGSKKVLLYSLMTATITALIHCFFSSYDLLGLSGIVFMFIILSASKQTQQRGIPLTFILVIVIYIGKELISIPMNDQISHLAHLSGGIIGLFLSWRYNKTT